MLAAGHCCALRLKIRTLEARPSRPRELGNSMKLKDIHWIPLTQLVVNLVTIAGFVVVLYQLENNRKKDYEQRSSQSVQLMFQINEHVRSGTSSRLVAAINSGAPIFEPKGKFTDEDVDNYLMNWELLAVAYDHSVINRGMLYDAFSYDISAAWKNPEIQKFIKDTRKQSGESDLYGGVEELATRFK
jgi:hypothetical protein